MQCSKMSQFRGLTNNVKVFYWGIQTSCRHGSIRQQFEDRIVDDTMLFLRCE